MARPQQESESPRGIRALADVHRRTGEHRGPTTNATDGRVPADLRHLCGQGGPSVVCHYDVIMWWRCVFTVGLQPYQIGWWQVLGPLQCGYPLVPCSEACGLSVLVLSLTDLRLGLFTEDVVGARIPIGDLTIRGEILARIEQIQIGEPTHYLDGSGLGLLQEVSQHLIFVQGVILIGLGVCYEP